MMLLLTLTSADDVLMRAVVEDRSSVPRLEEEADAAGLWLEITKLDTVADIEAVLRNAQLAEQLSERDIFYIEDQHCGHGRSVFFGKGDWIHLDNGTICNQAPEAPQ